MDAAQWLAANKALERLDAKREFAHGERALAAQAAGASRARPAGDRRKLAQMPADPRKAAEGKTCSRG